MTEPLSLEREQEIRESHPGEWYDGPWTQDYVDAEGDEPDYCRVVHHESGTVLATLPDFAGPIALFIADAHDAVPELLAELDRVRAERDELKAITVNTRRLSGHWSRQSSEALFGSQVDAMRTDPYGAGMRLGWANQASDCANELRDVLDGETADTVTEKASTGPVPTATPCRCAEPGRTEDQMYQCDADDCLAHDYLATGGALTLAGQGNYPQPDLSELREAIAAAAPEPVLTVHQERLLAHMGTATRTVWSTGPVEELYRTWHIRTPRHEARRDLAALADAGHLTRHGDDTGRRYRLNTRKDGQR